MSHVPYLYCTHQSIKYCCVLTCGNNSQNTDKLFVCVPKNDLLRRHSWLKKIGRPVGSDESDLYCCQDHFHFPTDCDNYTEWCENGGTLKMNKTAHPRYNLREKQGICGRILDDPMLNAFKWCFIPNCLSMINFKPVKLFFKVPDDDEMRRKRWFYAIRRSPKADLLFCCEDHFDFRTDLVDFPEYLINGCDIRCLVLKDDVVPHVNLTDPLFPSKREIHWAHLREKEKTKNELKPNDLTEKTVLDFEVEIINIKKESEVKKQDKIANRKSLSDKTNSKPRKTDHYQAEKNSKNYGGYKGAKIIQSRHGRDLLIYKGNTYCKSHVQKSGRIRWRCSGRTRKNCRAQFITEPDKTSIVKSSGNLEHNHEPSFPLRAYMQFEDDERSNITGLQKKVDNNKVQSEVEIIPEETAVPSLTKCPIEDSYLSVKNPQDEIDDFTEKKIYLLTLLPDLQEMSEAQLHLFKEQIYQIIHSIVG